MCTSFLCSRTSNVGRPPILPPTALDDSAPRPPERPPKNANLRSLHFASDNNFSASSNENRPYYYRRPPAPDPPLTPEEIPQRNGTGLTFANTEFPTTKESDAEIVFEKCVTSTLSSPLNGRVPPRTSYSSQFLSTSHSDLKFTDPEQITVAPIVATSVQLDSRSSSPELPPPPPHSDLEEGPTSADGEDEPLPPPPSTDISRSNSKLKDYTAATDVARPPSGSKPSIKKLSLDDGCNSHDTESRPAPLKLHGSFMEKFSFEKPNCKLEDAEEYQAPPPPPPKTPPPPLHHDDQAKREEETSDE